MSSHREPWHAKRISTLQQERNALLRKVNDIDMELAVLKDTQKRIWAVMVDELGGDYTVIGTSALYVEGLTSEVEDKVRPHLQGRLIRSIRPVDIIQ